MRWWNCVLNVEIWKWQWFFLKPPRKNLEVNVYNVVVLNKKSGEFKKYEKKNKKTILLR